MDVERPADFRGRIRAMFGAVAPGYDRANQVLSLGMHHRWRHRAVRLACARPGEHVLDCATGTGDLALAFKKAVGPHGRVVGLDFSESMLTLAARKASARKVALELVAGDVMHLPFADGTFDIAAIAFGIRNVIDPAAGISEMARVVRPGGRVVVLEFGQPDALLFGQFYRWYSRAMIPRIGGWITGKPTAYRYLQESAAAFPAGETFAGLMKHTGVFATVAVRSTLGKIAYVYVGVVR